MFLKGVRARDLETFLQFIYFGEVSVPSQDLERLIGIAKELGIKGLDGVGGGSRKKKNDVEEEDEDEAPLAFSRRGKCSQDSNLSCAFFLKKNLKKLYLKLKFENWTDLSNL